MDHERRHVGRVVFRSPTEWVVLTLQSHVDNVTKLVEQWETEKAYLHAGPAGEQHELVVEAARIHDMGKPAHFRLRVEKSRDDVPKWEYSFAGHRFAVQHSHPYVYWLGQLHHEYSVEGITTAMATLRQYSEYRHLAPYLPLDLYTLEMADQIEATVARAAIGAEDPEERVFMDFAFHTADRERAIYQIDPFPFQGDSISLVVHYCIVTPPPAKLRAVEDAEPSRQSPFLRDLEDWLNEALQDAPLEAQEITLCPWT